MAGALAGAAAAGVSETTPNRSGCPGVCSTTPKCWPGGRSESLDDWCRGRSGSKGTSAGRSGEGILSLPFALELIFVSAAGGCGGGSIVDDDCSIGGGSTCGGGGSFGGAVPSDVSMGFASSSMRSLISMFKGVQRARGGWKTAACSLIADSFVRQSSLVSLGVLID